MIAGHQTHGIVQQGIHDLDIGRNPLIAHCFPLPSQFVIVPLKLSFQRCQEYLFLRFRVGGTLSLEMVEEDGFSRLVGCKSDGDRVRRRSDRRAHRIVGRAF